MGRVCINDHRPEHSMGGDGWTNGCAQCELDKLRADLAIAEQEADLWEERARHLGWKDAQAPNAELSGRPLADGPA